MISLLLQSPRQSLYTCRMSINNKDIYHTNVPGLYMIITLQNSLMYMHGFTG